MNRRFKECTGFVLAAALMLQPLLLAAQDTPNSGKPANALGNEIHPIGLPDFAHSRRGWPNVLLPYSAFDLGPIDAANGPGVDKLFKDGKIYLSLADAISLAIENNLDVAIQRLNAPMSDTDILRTKAGVGTRVGRASVTEGSSINVGGGSFLGGVGPAPLFGGPPGFQQGTTSFDPVFFGTLQFNHSNIPVTSVANIATQGAVSVVTPNTFTGNMNYSQAFQSGTQLNVNLNNQRATNVQNILVPQFQTSLGVTVSQHLLDGFGMGPNRRQIIIAKNNREVTDLVFKLQIVTTVSQVANLYWTLVSDAEDVKVQERSLQVSEKLLNDNKRQVEIGTLAPIEVVRAEAEVASGRQNLIVSQSTFRQAGTSMKNLILKNISDPSILTAEVIPTDKIDVPPIEPVVPVQDLVSQAITARTELQQSRIDMSNRDLSIKTTKNSLLPQLDAFGSWSGSGVAGTQNPIYTVGANPNLIGGYASALGQSFSGNYPNYAIGAQLTMVLRNRSAQADLAQALLEKRQSDLRVKQLENQVRVEVVNAQIALVQNRVRIDAARKQRELAERSLDAEQKKFQLGASTNYLVIQAQRDLTTALSAEVQALGLYMISKVEMERTTGQTLVRNAISLEEAAQGQLKTAPKAAPIARQD